MTNDPNGREAMRQVAHLQFVHEPGDTLGLKGLCSPAEAVDRAVNALWDAGYRRMDDRIQRVADMVEVPRHLIEGPAEADVAAEHFAAMRQSIADSTYRNGPQGIAERALRSHIKGDGRWRLVMTTDDGTALYPDGPEDARWMADEHGATPHPDSAAYGEDWLAYFSETDATVRAEWKRWALYTNRWQRHNAPAAMQVLSHPEEIECLHKPAARFIEWLDIGVTMRRFADENLDPQVLPALRGIVSQVPHPCCVFCGAEYRVHLQLLVHPSVEPEYPEGFVMARGELW
jgi:hypothetical protein